MLDFTPINAVLAFVLQEHAPNVVVTTSQRWSSVQSFSWPTASARDQPVIILQDDDNDRRLEQCPCGPTSWFMMPIVDCTVSLCFLRISPDALLFQPLRLRNFRCTGRRCIVFAAHHPVDIAAYFSSRHSAVLHPTCTTVRIVAFIVQDFPSFPPLYGYTPLATRQHCIRNTVEMSKRRQFPHPSSYLSPTFSSLVSELRTLGDDIYASASTLSGSLKSYLADTTKVTASPRLGGLINKPQLLLGFDKRVSSLALNSRDCERHDPIELDVLVGGRRSPPPGSAACGRSSKNTRELKARRPSRSIDVTEETLSQIWKTLLHLQDPDDVEYAEEYHRHKMDAERRELKKWARLAPGITQGSWLNAIDYMLELHRRQNLWDSTLWIGADILYRYLCLCSPDDLKAATLKMLAAVSIHIAANFHQTEIQSLWAYEDEFDVLECIHLERKILATINYSIPLHSTPNYWLDLIATAGQMNDQSKNLAHHLAFLTLRDNTFFKCSSRYKAAVAIYCTRLILKQGRWDACLAYFSGFQQADLRAGCDKMISIVSTAEGNWVAGRIEAGTWTHVCHWSSTQWN